MLTQNILVHVLLFISHYDLHMRSFHGAVLVFLLQSSAVLSDSVLYQIVLYYKLMTASPENTVISLRCVRNF